MSGPGGQRLGDGELLSNRYRVSVGEDEKVLEMYGGDNCRVMCVYLMSLNDTLKMAEMVNFMLHLFYHN